MYPCKDARVFSSRRINAIALSGLILVMLSVMVSPVNAQQSKAPLLRAADLTYLGAFRVPRDGAELQDSLAYGGSALAINPERNSLLLTGHIYFERTAEISLETPLIADTIEQLPTASFIATPIDATRGLLGNVSNPPAQQYARLGGQILVDGKLIVSGYHFYDVAGISTASHLQAQWPLTGSHNVEGPVSLSANIYPRWLAGPMARVPAEWQGAFNGYSLLTGLSGVSGASYSSVGPAAAAFSPATLAGQGQAQLLVGYPLSQPLDDPEATSDLWNLTSEVRGMAFPKGSRSVLFFGRHGIGEYCYGTGEQCNDPVHVHQGTHAYPYRNQIWAYDANDLAAVASGAAQSETLQPYDYWELDLPFAPDIHSLGGAVYDPRNNRIYVSQREADGDFPLIHVLAVKIDDADDEDLVTVPIIQSPVPGSVLAGNGDVLRWQGISGNNPQYRVYAGNRPGKRGYFDSDALGSQTFTPIGNLPTNGRSPVHIRLWYRSDGSPWSFVDQKYIAGSTVNKLELVSPKAGARVFGNATEVRWRDNGQGNTQFWVSVGLSPGRSNYFNSGQLSGSDLVSIGERIMVTGLPADNRPVSVRLWHRSGTGTRWRYLDRRIISKR